MKKFLFTILFTGLIISGFSFAKGFKMGGFKSYKSYKSQSTLKHGNEPVSKKYNTQNLKNKFNKSSTNKLSSKNKKPSFLSNPMFKWLIGGMIFGAILSMLMGYGFHFGMPGVLEIILLIGVVYLIYKSFQSSKRKEEAYKLNEQ